MSEEVYRRRLELRLESCTAIVNESLTIIQKSTEEGVSDGELNITINQLRKNIQGLENDFYKLGPLIVDNEFLNRVTDTQLQAEKVLLDVENIQTQFEILKKEAPPNRPSSTKLPTLEMIKFNGNVCKFYEFWDRFQAAVGQRDLQDVDKMTYLMSVLEGPALSAVKGLEISNQNYTIALDTLKKLYGDKDTQIDTHYDMLYKIEKTTYDAEQCRHTLNLIDQHLRVLQSLGENVEGNHLRKLILDKFPDKIIYEINIMNENDKRVKGIRSALERIISSMERACTKEPDQFTTQNLCATSVPSKKRPFREHNREEPPKKKTKKACIFCTGEHFNDECLLSFKERKEKLGKRCYLCFKVGHPIKTCKDKRRCYYCNKKHNRALCHNKTKSVNSNHSDNKREPSTSTTPSTNTVSTAINPTTLLQTATIFVQKRDLRYIKCRALLDSGSQRSYISGILANQIQPRLQEDNYLIVYTFGSNVPKEFHSPIVNIHIRTKSDKEYDMQVNVIVNIADNVTRIPDHFLQLIPRNKSIIIADDYSEQQRIDLLIGNDYYFNFIHTEKIQLQENLYIINTDFGWIFSGKHCNESKYQPTMSFITYVDSFTHSQISNYVEPDPPLREDSIKKIWDLEIIGISDSPKLQRDEEAVEKFNQTLIYSNNRYYIQWPWTEFPPDLPDNLGVAYGRLRSLLRRSNAETLELYDKTIKEQLELGVIEEALPPQQGSHYPVHYLPHHGVIQEGHTTKLRIVYDGSAKTKDNSSLNQCLYKGPLLLEDLIGIILRFRLYKYGLVADVEKAFLQIGLQESDRDVTRFLWIKDVNTEPNDENIIHYRFCRVPFGIVSSPFILAATINYHLKRTNTAVAETIASNMYVDNLIVSVKTEEEAKTLYKVGTSLFQEMSMNLREWQSNSSQLESIILGPQTTNVNILGLSWNKEKDTLKLKSDVAKFLSYDVNTKRDVLKVIASVYDPCGYIAPILLATKLFLQDLWRLKYKWDSKLSQEHIDKWREIILAYKEISEFEIPRSMLSDYDRNFQEDSSLELHCFCDASLQAYTAIVYLRTVREVETKVSFIMSKTRLKSIKDKDDLKIPKLELLAALIGTRLLSYVTRMLNIKIEKQILWTDSQIVISWTKTQKLLPPFVNRRIKEIKDNSNLQIRFVPSESNPADVGTRPLKGNLKDTIWVPGPKFLKNKEEDWPITHTHMFTSNIAGEEGLSSERKEMETENIEIGEVIEKHTTQEDKESEKIRHLQQKYFPQEYNGKITDMSRNLQLFKDDKGILRCKGRYHNTGWQEDKINPILLPKDDDFTLDVITKIHCVNYHVGTSHTLAILREKYWVPKGRSQVQKAIHRCLQCRKYGGGPFKLPVIPDLPKERVTYNAPFTYTGLDYLGPLYVNTAQGKQKRWVCIYTCLAVRAVHLEVVTDMTADECLSALRRFVSIRGLPAMITSDNALQFKLTSEVLSTPYCTENNIKWRFIPQLAPWYGGFYERLVGLVKHCLKRTIEKHLLSESQLQTIIKEIESILNTRPLTYVGSELDHVLKPVDFLHLGKPLIPIPADTSFNNPETITKERLIEGWKKGMNIVKEFINMFTNQYLPSLREKHKPHKEPRVKTNREPRVGEIVQIKSDGSRATWKVGKIKELVRSKDGHVRVAKVEITPNSILTRSVAHLYPLELEDPIHKESERTSQETSEVNNELVESQNVPDVLSNSSNPERRPQRAAAIKARQLLKELSSQLFAIDK